MSDDHTSQAWGVYGSVLDPVIEAPNIDRLTTEGCLLRNAFCTNSICTPSRATILTGQYSHINGVYTLADALDPGKENVAKILQKNGYQTAIMGKWHLKSQPSGFDDYNVLPGQGRYQDPILRNAENWENGGKEYKGYSADVIVDQCLEWLSKRNKEEPFYLMCHFKATHEPFDYPERYKDLYEGVDMPEPDHLYEWYPSNTTRTFQGQILEILKDRYETSPGRYPGNGLSIEGMDSITARKATYQKFIKDFLRGGRAIDDNIGRLLDYLDGEGIQDNTVVVYTADQGYFLGEHGLFDKRIMYEEPLRMPFVIRYPEEIKGGDELHDIVLNTDFAPLFLDYAGIEVPAFMQGKSFRSNLRHQTPDDWRSSMYYRYFLHETKRPAHFGIRTARYKLIFFYGHPLNKAGAQKKSVTPTWEFYDLEKDPNEINNAYYSPEYKSVISALKSELLQLKSAVGDDDADNSALGRIMDAHWND
jgi:arylsulfatase A-like enzyme